MLRKSMFITALAAASATLATAGSAAAATGHACTVNGLAAGCPAALNIPAGSDLIATDVGVAAADDFVFLGPGNLLRCRDATAKGVLTSAGGPAYPIGGAGPKGYVPGASITGPTGTRCTGGIPGAATTGTVTLLDGNGAAPGLVDFTGTWLPNLGTAQLTLRAPIFGIREFVGAALIATCTYRGTAFTGSVTNNAAGRVNFTSQPVTKLAGPAVCPVNATITVPFNVRWAAGGVVGPFRISA